MSRKPSIETQLRQAIEELRNLTTCRCDESWTGRGLHSPDCNQEFGGEVETVAAALTENCSLIADLAQALFSVRIRNVYEGPCWCEPNFGVHSFACEKARALLARVPKTEPLS